MNIILKMKNSYRDRNGTNNSFYGLAKKSLPYILASTVIGTSLASIRGSDNLSRHLDKQPVIEPTTPRWYRFQARSYQEIVEFVRQYKDKIIQSARNEKINPELIVAVLIDHNYLRLKFEDWKDKFGASSLGRLLEIDPSLGPGQVNVSTAASLDKIAGIEPKNRTELERALQNPETNVGYIASTIADLIKDLPESEATNILGNPSSAFKIGSMYRRGNSERATAPNLEGLIFVGILGNKDFREFLGDESTITPEQQANMRYYVGNTIQKNPPIRDEVERATARLE